MVVNEDMFYTHGYNHGYRNGEESRQVDLLAEVYEWWIVKV